MENKTLSIASTEKRCCSRVYRTVLAAVFLITAGCTGNASEKHAVGDKRNAAMPVTVADVVQMSVPIELQAVGTVQAYATVTVRSQVEGLVTAVHLREGQCINSGDLLFDIDPRPFQARLKQAEANLARDKAQLDNARTLLERNAAVVAKGYVSKEQYDQSSANAEALAAIVRADEAALEDARIQLAYSAIRAPITGCAGEIFVDRGNVVKANDADHPLVVIRQINPIYVGFSVPERYLPQIRKFSADRKLIVMAAAAGNDGSPAKGELVFVDNSVNTATGTILLKAAFDNPGRSLWPGQFVNATLQLASQPQAVVVPSQAVQTGQQGQYVFILKPDQTVDYRQVVVDRSTDGKTVVASGLNPGDKVVTDGQLRLYQGASVKIIAGPDQKGES